MHKKDAQVNNDKNRNLRKILIIAVSVIAVIAAAVIAVLFNVNSIYLKQGKAKLEENSFTDAKYYFEKCSTDEGEILRKYAELRIDINKKYPAMLTEYDEELIESWCDSAAETVNNIDVLPEEIKADAIGVYTKLKTIKDAHEKYNLSRNDILEMMDVFAEFNRLYSKDADGKNTTFTVSDETVLIERWEELNENLQEFQNEYFPDGSVYLLSYLIKECQGECLDLRNAMKVVTDAGYSETDTVRLSGEGTKTFPGVTNTSGNTVNVARKDEYESYMSQGINRGLVEMLSGYYTGY